MTNLYDTAIEFLMQVMLKQNEKFRVSLDYDHATEQEIQARKEARKISGGLSRAIKLLNIFNQADTIAGSAHELDIPIHHIDAKIGNMLLQIKKYDDYGYLRPEQEKIRDQYAQDVVVFQKARDILSDVRKNEGGQEIEDSKRIDLLNKRMFRNKG